MNVFQEQKFGRPTVTIGIPAYNEEANIDKLLQAILAQKEDSFVIQEILVVSDGSNDDTVSKACAIQDARIVVIDGEGRLGKNQRVNYIFANAKSDYVVLFDADVMPVSSDTISNLIKPFSQDKRIAYVAGRLEPRPARTFIEQCTIVSRKVWDKLRMTLHDGNSVYSFTGGICALSGSFARSTQFPPSIWADIYLYFSCITRGFLFRSAKSARVWFRSPTTIQEYLNQTKRYDKESDTLVGIFGSDVIEREYHVPKGLLYRYKLLSFALYPAHSLAIFFLNAYACYSIKHRPNVIDAAWQVSESSKSN